ncbi:MAG: hypothetical protein HQL93_07175 [Magnetococcales bacterium]|nr:hypothetical protein [Magnetococcales bacterium]
MLIPVVWTGLFVASPAWGELNLWPVRFKGQLSPWRVWGYSGYQLSSNMIKDQRPSTEHISTTNVNLSRGAKGFVWKPWVVQWNAEVAVGGTTTQRMILASVNNREPDTTSLSRDVSGRYDFTVLPESRFPLKVYYNRLANDVSEGLTMSGGRSSQKDAMGLVQEYKSQEGDLRALARWDHSRDLMGGKNKWGYEGVSIPSLDTIENHYTSDLKSLGVTQIIEGQSVDLQLKRAMDWNQSQGNKARLIDDAAVLSHSVVGGQVWSVNTLGNLSKLHATLNTETQAENFFKTRQLGSSTFWRSEDMPLFVSGSGRVGVSTQEYLPNSDGKVIMRNASLGTGVSYQFTPEVKVDLTLSANYAESESLTNFLVHQDATEILTANYSPVGSPVGDFMHNWYITGGLNNHQTIGTRPLKSANTGIGQSLTRDIPLDNTSILNFSASQTEFMNHATKRNSIYGINHAFGGRYTEQDSSNRTYLDVSLADTRSLGDLISNAQTISSQFSVEGNVEPGGTWQGHLTSQIFRTKDQGKLTTGSNSGINIMYQQSNLFGWQGLTYSSRIQMDATEKAFPLTNLVGSIAKHEGRSWWNFLDFALGNLSGRMTFGVTESHGQQFPFDRTGLFLFQVQRSFDLTFSHWSLPSFLIPPTNTTEREKENE